MKKINKLFAQRDWKSNRMICRGINEERIDDDWDSSSPSDNNLDEWESIGFDRLEEN